MRWPRSQISDRWRRKKLGLSRTLKRKKAPISTPPSTKVRPFGVDDALASIETK